ncbi:hypothetical protein M404DRAFT_263934 [Pisolithus tinctorius Marx 270]|uniref:Uncharacterized protein n=1 Tax=Pisolithus tinctorius Marx 270 TaxID=870435 RepID=A0A0C3P7M6_PISTI|nr:hypothetical protein M404DRAFT_263934 [Pisolithus tinctorius Marx 270]
MQNGIRSSNSTFRWGVFSYLETINRTRIHRYVSLHMVAAQIWNMSAIAGPTFVHPNIPTHKAQVTGSYDVFTQANPDLLDTRERSCSSTGSLLSPSHSAAWGTRGLTTENGPRRCAFPLRWSCAVIT